MRKVQVYSANELRKGQKNMVGDVSIIWSSVWEEFEVMTPLGSTYHTGDRDDAYDTAVLMDRTA